MKILFLIGLLSLSYPEPTYRMEISYVNINILTFMQVDCHEFENAFGDIKTINISDQETIERVWNLMDELTVFKYKDFTPDTRRKLRIWKDGCFRTACLDRFIVYYNNVPYTYDGELRNIIEGLIENHSE